MQSTLDCLPCLIRQAITAAERATSDSSRRECIARQTLRLTADADLADSPPAIAGEIYQIITEVTGNRDPFKAQKDQSNRLALQLYPQLKQCIETAVDPLETALRLAIAGNIIDFGIPEMDECQDLDATIRHALEAPLPNAVIDAFRNAVEAAGNILYLGDNAGEIVFDKLLIQQLPAHKITFAVRGAPIINDATMADAVAVGLTGHARVISNGTAYPGTIREKCSAQFQEVLRSADLVIAKGQGNFETLEAPEKEVFYLLKVKCAVVSRRLDRPLGDIVLLRQPAANT